MANNRILLNHMKIYKKNQERQEKINKNLKLVSVVLREFKYRNKIQYTDLEDLFQVGCIGLIKSVDNFNINLGFKFSTYAFKNIYFHMKNYLARHKFIFRIPEQKRELLYKIIKINREFSMENQCEPTIEYIVKKIKIPKIKVENIINCRPRTTSLYLPIGNDGENQSISIMDQIVDEKNTDSSWAENVTLSEALKKLNEREKLIVNLRFFEDKKLKEIAREIGLTVSGVEMATKRILKKIKKLMEEK